MEKVERWYFDSCGGDLWEGDAAKETELDDSEILHKMEERRKCKNMRDEEQYKKLKQEIRRYVGKPKTNIMKISARRLKCWIRHTAN